MKTFLIFLAFILFASNAIAGIGASYEDAKVSAV